MPLSLTWRLAKNYIQKTTVERNLLYNKLATNIKERMTTNDDKSRHSLSGCQVAVGDAAPGRPSLTVTGRSRVIADMFGRVIAE